MGAGGTDCGCGVPVPSPVPVPELPGTVGFVGGIVGVGEVGKPLPFFTFNALRKMRRSSGFSFCMACPSTRCSASVRRDSGSFRSDLRRVVAGSPVWSDGGGGATLSGTGGAGGGIGAVSCATATDTNAAAHTMPAIVETNQRSTLLGDWIRDFCITIHLSGRVVNTPFLAKAVNDPGKTLSRLGVCHRGNASSLRHESRHDLACYRLCTAL